MSVRVIVPSPATATDGLTRMYLAIGLAVFAIVATILIVVVVRYRDRGDDRVPSRRSSASRLESAYVLILAGFVALLVTRTIQTEARVDSSSRRPAVVIDATASKWRWRFAYAGTAIVAERDGISPPVLVVPAGATV